MIELSFGFALILISVAMFSYGVFNFWNSIWGYEAILIRKRAEKLLMIEAQSSKLSSGIIYRNANLKRSKINRIFKISQIEIFLEQAGFAVNLKFFSLILLTTSIIFFLILIFLKFSILISLVLVVAINAIIFIYLHNKRSSRLKKIDLQLPDTLDLMARAMQSGHAFSSALMIVGSEGPSPIRNEFQKTFDEINFGISTESALKNLTQRVSSNELRFFVVAVIIQLETGGNLAGVLSTLAELMRDRQRIAGTIRVLTAEGRLSAWILGLLPFVIGSFLSIINPGFISKLWTDPLGLKMLEGAALLMGLGILWMWRMVRVPI